MPVEEHEVHPATQHGDEFRYGCNNAKPRPRGYFVLTRTYYGDAYDLNNEWVENTMSKHCRNVDYDSHPGCRDCPQPKDLEYINKMKELT